MLILLFWWLLVVAIVLLRRGAPASFSVLLVFIQAYFTSANIGFLFFGIVGILLGLYFAFKAWPKQWRPALEKNLIVLPVVEANRGFFRMALSLLLLFVCCTLGDFWSGTGGHIMLSFTSHIVTGMIAFLPFIVLPALFTKTMR